MPKRTIKTALGTYRAADGAFGAYGFRGDEVDVHTDDVKRFDELNVETGDGEPYTEPRASVDLLSSPGAEVSGDDSGLNTTVSDKEAAESTADKPARSSRKK